MNRNEISTIDWSSPDVLSCIFQNIKNPLETIMSAANGADSTSLQKEVIFSSSKQINEMIEKILFEVNSKSVKLSFSERPDIFMIYNENKTVQSMCSKKIIPEKITKPDQEWLMGLEKEIYNSVNKGDINIYDLSYKMAVSERQMYRKLTSLIYLTPNKYIRVLRLHKARKMIDNYIQHSLSQIAYAVGYNDVNYFTRLFSEQYSVSPRELINSLRY